jgi:hypothetical protein
MSSLNIATEPATRKSAKEQPSQEQIAAALTERWEPALGKSVESVLEIGSILFDAKEKLEKTPYEIWLKNTAKMSESTASKYRSIHECPMLRKDEFKKLLPPDWTAMYHLSKFSRADELTPAQAKSKFKDALAFIRKESPTSEELSVKVNELLGKTAKPKTPQAPVDPVLEQTAQDMLGKSFASLPPEGQSKIRDFAAKDQGTAQELNSETDQPGRPDDLTGLSVNHEATSPLGTGVPTPAEDGEPTPEQIKEAERLAAEDDGVEVDVQVELERFRLATLKIQIRKLMKASGVTEPVKVIVAPKATEASA